MGGTWTLCTHTTVEVQRTNVSGALRHEWHIYVTALPQGSRTITEEVKRMYSQRLARTRVKHCLLDLTGPLYSWTYCSRGWQHMVMPVNILACSGEKFMILYPKWQAMSTQGFLEGMSVFFKGVYPGRSWPSGITWVDSKIWGGNVIFFRGREVWVDLEGVKEKSWDEYNNQNALNEILNE